MVEMRFQVSFKAGANAERGIRIARQFLVATYIAGRKLSNLEIVAQPIDADGETQGPVCPPWFLTLVPDAHCEWIPGSQYACRCLSNGQEFDFGDRRGPTTVDFVMQNFQSDNGCRRDAYSS